MPEKKTQGGAHEATWGANETQKAQWADKNGEAARKRTAKENEKRAAGEEDA